MILCWTRDTQFCSVLRHFWSKTAFLRKPFHIVAWQRIKNDIWTRIWLLYCERLVFIHRSTCVCDNSFFYFCLLNRTRSVHYFIYIVVGRNHVFDLFQIRKKSLRQNLKQVSSRAYVLCYKAIFPYVKLLSTTALRQRARATLKLLLWSVCWHDFQ